MKDFLKHFGIIIILFISCVIFFLSHQIGGWRIFIVLSSSMTPAIKTGSLVVTQTVDTKLLKKNDIITFIPPLPKREFVTHRIVNITQKNNVSVFKTKGDNNKTIDPWILPSGGVVGNVFLTIPYLGYIFSFTQTKVGIILFILLPAVFIITEEIKVMIGTVRNHKRQKKINQEKIEVN